MSILKKTIDRDFTGCELFNQIGEFKVYYPQTEEKMKKFIELTSKSDIKDGEVAFTSEDVVCEMFELLTNVDVDKCIRGKEKLSFKLATVLNYVQEVIFDTFELMLSQQRVDSAKERLGLDESKIVTKKNRNDREVIIEQMKEIESERKNKEQEDKVLDDENLDSQIVELEKQRKILELKKQIEELEK